MDRGRSPSGPPTRHLAAPHTSSAFSASAQPNEDWTKISDLAQRRRIQNRIAQRNYRKKQKKRIEHLERKAASTTPEPEPASRSRDVPPPTSSSSSRPSAAKKAGSKRRPSPAPAPQPPNLLPHQTRPPMDDWTMFSDQHTRQLSTSPPPPFRFPTLDAFRAAPSPPLPSDGFPYLPCAEPAFHYQPYLQPLDPNYPWEDEAAPVKQEGFPDNDMGPLSLPGYMPLDPVDMSFASSLSESSLTPELCDMYEYSSAGSPGDFNTFPQTPMMIPLSPPCQYFE